MCALSLIGRTCNERAARHVALSVPRVLIPDRCCCPGPAGLLLGSNHRPTIPVVPRQSSPFLPRPHHGCVCRHDARVVASLSCIVFDYLPSRVNNPAVVTTMFSLVEPQLDDLLGSERIVASLCGFLV